MEADGLAGVVALGATRCKAVAWRVKGQLRLTVVVKASFDLVPGGPMTPAAPEDMVGVETHHRNTPTQSVRLTTDLAPFIPAADALLVGHAHAPEGTSAQALTVRFAIFRERALVEKIIHVYGERKGAGGEITPFEEMPLVYERAFGGLGNRENPFGTGAGANDKAPNLVDPGDPKKPACFAPISAAWPGRKRQLDRAQQEGLKQPIVEIVGDLSFQYFHAAPPDQRIPQYLKGNEWVVLDGMHPTQRSVQSRLPDVAAAARVYGLGEIVSERSSTPPGGPAEGGSPAQALDGGRDVALVLDTLRIDADSMVCSLVWRGHVPVPDEATLASLEVVGGVSLGEQAIEWPARLEEDVLVEYDSISGATPDPDPQAAQRAARGAQRPALDGTTTVTPDDEKKAAARKPLPFVAGAAGRAPIAAPPPRPPPHQAPTGTLDGTMAITPIGEPSKKIPTLPFAQGPTTTGEPPKPPGTMGEPPKQPPARPEAPKPQARAGVTPDLLGTIQITREEAQAAVERPAVPFVPAAPAAPAAPPSAPAAPPAPFTMGVQAAPPLEEPSAPAPTFLKKAPRTLLGVAPAPTGAAPAAPRRRPARTALGIELFPHGPLAIEVVPWGCTPARDVLAVIAKATCDVVPEGPAVPRAAADPPAGEAYAGPPRRCVYPSDLVPYKVRADVVLVGHAVAPGGAATSMEVTFHFGSKANGFARTVLVFGDRRWQKAKVGMEPSAPEPFGRMALAFDHAFGGRGFAANVAGIGHHDPMHRGPVPLPNLEDPEQILRSPRQSPPPALFAPIPLAWKDRWAEAHASGLCLAEALDWARFQAAPAAQQLAFLRGDEAYAVTGLSARHPSIAGALPGIHARCFVARKGAAPAGGGAARLDELALRLDTVVFDVDAMKLDLVWRGALPVADELQPDVLGLYLLADKLDAETPFAEACVKVLRP